MMGLYGGDCVDVIESGAVTREAQSSGDARNTNR
jgi:hypothetical protein